MLSKKRQVIPYKYATPAKAIVFYYASLFVAIGALLVRRNDVFWSSLPFTASWGTHISNFVISYLIYTAVGLTWILQGAPRKALIWLGVVLLALNITIESFITVLNTPDTVDMAFGVAGVLAGLGAVYLLDKTKLKANKT